MYAFLELARDVLDLPTLRLAVVRGQISPRKARSVAAAIRRHPEWEGTLLRAAREKTLPEIRQIVEELGEESPAETFVVDTLRLRMSPEMQDLLDSAIALARTVLGPGRPRWVYEESIAMEWLAEHGDLAPEKEEDGAEGGDEGGRRRARTSIPPSPEVQRRLLSEWEDQGIEEAIVPLLVDEEAVFAGEPAEVGDAEALLTRILRLLSIRRKRDDPLGRVLETISTLRLHAFLGWSNFTDYAVERLGISERAARQRVWLERRMLEFPELRAALAAGRLTYSTALVVARDATPEDVRERIREAEETSWQQLDRKSTEEEDRQNRAVGIRRLWGPEEVVETIAAAIAAAITLALEKEGVKITAGEALALISARFIEEWKDPVRRKRMKPLRKEVFERTRGICAVPGCGNPADHAHHVVYGSHCGPDAAWNLAAVCAACHRRIHRGWIRVEGRAGERLHWRIRRGRGRWEVWETIGEDDVRRIGEEVDAGVRKRTEGGWLP